MDKEKVKYSFSFISFDAHKPPVIFEQKNKEYIIFGNDSEYYNNYPKYLLDNYNKSSIHNSICNGKINYIVGSGLEVKYFSDPSALALAKATIKSVNDYEDADDLNRKLSTDLVIFGGFYAELIQTKGGNIQAFHLSFDYIRRSKEDENVWYYTKDWTCRKPEQNEDFKTFHTFEGKFESGKNYLVDYSLYRAGNEPYALPDYLAANGYIELDWRIGNFLLQNVKSGFSAGFILNFYNGHPEPDQQRDIERQIKKKFGGDDAGGSFVLNFNDPESKSAEIVPIPTNGHDDRFNTLKEAVRDNLFTAHNITNPMLFGVREAGSLGGSTEIIESFNLMQNTWTNNRQILLEKFWNDLLVFKGVGAKLAIIEAQPLGESEKVNEVALALGTLSPLVATKILEAMTNTEVRALIGLEGSVIKTQEANNTTTTNFSKEDTDSIMLEFFNSCGIDDDDLEVIESRELMASSIEDAESQRLNFATITDLQSQILSIIVANPNTPVAEIAEAIGETPQATMDQIDIMRANGLVDLNKDSNPEPTEEGKKENENEVFLVYKYAERLDAPPLKGESRFFCKTLMSLNRSYTLADIKRLRNGQGLDVFTSRGGWYTKPNTNTHAPYCRHTWVQRLVKRKKK